MATPKPSNEMPFGVAVLFTLIGAGLFVAFLCGLVAPTLWVRFAYRPATATVLWTHPTEQPTKGGRLYGLEARLGYTVDGREYRRWLVLPRTTRRREGPEADAIRTQLAVGQRVQCFHDPLRPGAGVVLIRPALEFSLLFALLFPLVFLGGGIGGMALAWRRTFPRGAVLEIGDRARRLPRRFFLAVLGAVLFAAAGWYALEFVGPSLGGLAVVVLLGAIAGTVVMVRRAVRYGSVAFPSPERRAAQGREAGHPAVAEAPVIPPSARWAPADPVAIDPGRRLPARLRPDMFAGAPGSGSCLVFTAVLSLGLAVTVLAVSRSSGPAGRGRESTPGAMVLVPLLAIAAAVWTWQRVARRVRGLAIEVSGHPLRAGGHDRLVAVHEDPRELDGLRLELVCREEADSRGGRGGKTTARHTAARHPLAFDPGGSTRHGGVRYARLDVPPGAVPSLALENHRISWSVAVRVGGRIPWTIYYPVRVEAAERAESEWPPSSREDQPGRLDDGTVALWTGGGHTVFPPGAVVSGGYAVSPSDTRTLGSVELSVLWQTMGSGIPELGVCYYEDRAAVDGDDLPLYGARSFHARLPDGPPSYEGTLVKIRWAVRLRLRYADGEELVRELAIRLGRAEA